MFLRTFTFYDVIEGAGPGNFDAAHSAKSPPDQSLVKSTPKKPMASEENSQPELFRFAGADPNQKPVGGI